MQKKCTKCDVLKPLHKFSRNRRRLDGYSSWCKKCVHEHFKKNYKPKRKSRAKPHRPRRYNHDYYQLIYCPKDSWTRTSKFTMEEIVQMLRHGCLYVGTKFRRGEIEYRVTDDMRMVEL